MVIALAVVAVIGIAVVVLKKEKNAVVIEMPEAFDSVPVSPAEGAPAVSIRTNPSLFRTIVGGVFCGMWLFSLTAGLIYWVLLLLR